MSVITKSKSKFTNVNRINLNWPNPDPGLIIFGEWVTATYNSDDEPNVPRGTRVIVYWADGRKAYAPNPPFENQDAPSSNSFEVYKVDDVEIVGSQFIGNDNTLFAQDVYLIRPKKDLTYLKRNMVYQAIMRKGGDEFIVREDSGIIVS